MQKPFASYLGSARASRAGDGALAIANFSADISNNLTGDDKINCGEARALTRHSRRIIAGFALLSYVLTLLSCETSNYAPPVTTEMARSASAKKQIDQSQLEHGRTLFVHRCIECHTLPPMWKYSRQDWPQIVNDMSHRASLKPEERTAVIAYILAARKQM